jgi:hypothetical protein
VFFLVTSIALFIAMKVSHLITPISAVLLLAASTSFARFIPPQDNPPFRRDQLPIDVATMKQLSAQLTTLCLTLDFKDPSQQRIAAQFLAIAQALDPINRAAQDAVDRFLKDTPVPPPNPAEITLAKSKAWRIQAWLASDEAGPDAAQLAQCLGDVLARVDPNHPSAKSHESDQGSWAEWVAALKEFQTEVATAETTPALAEATTPSAEEMLKNGTTTPAEQPTPTVPTPATFALKESSIRTPLFLMDAKQERSLLKVAQVHLKCGIDEQYPDFRYDFKDADPERMRPILRMINQATVPWLKNQGSGLPTGGVIGLSLFTQNAYPIARNGENLSAAAAVLAHAALTGKEPTGIVLGIIRPDGKLQMPADGWAMIRLLASAPPSRIVIPRSAAELLPGMLTLDELGFFMKHDVFVADQIDELIAFSLKDPDPETAAALATFASIRAKSTSSIGAFVANPYVRTKLESTAKDAPKFASAQYLLLQSTGKRPAQLPTKVAAYEIRSAIAPLQQIMHEMNAGNRQNWQSGRLLEAHEASRKALDPLERLISSSEKELYQQSIHLANTARTLARAMKKVGNQSNGTGNFHDKLLNESFKALNNGLPDLDQKLNRILAAGNDNRPRFE